jgi:hypothetical protein
MEVDQGINIELSQQLDGSREAGQIVVVIAPGRIRLNVAPAYPQADDAEAVLSQKLGIACIEAELLGGFLGLGNQVDAVQDHDVTAGVSNPFRGRTKLWQPCRLGHDPLLDSLFDSLSFGNTAQRSESRT